MKQSDDSSRRIEILQETIVNIEFLLKVLTDPPTLAVLTQQLDLSQAALKKLRNADSASAASS